MYEKAHDLLMGGDYRGAVRYYEALEARYPFSEEARQGRLDIIYAYYRAREQESAVDAADQFVRENPTQPARRLRDVPARPHLLRALAELPRALVQHGPERAPSSGRAARLRRLRPADPAAPNSIYAHDARQRMVFLRNRLADYEVYVARHYLDRQAYVAAIDRARYTVENYDGAPAVRQALEIMIDSYHRTRPRRPRGTLAGSFALNFPDAEPRDADKAVVVA